MLSKNWFWKMKSDLCSFPESSLTPDDGMQPVKVGVVSCSVKWGTEMNEVRGYNVKTFTPTTFAVEFLPE